MKNIRLKKRILSSPSGKKITPFQALLVKQGAMMIGINL
jgi:hypothetical protein